MSRSSLPRRAWACGSALALVLALSGIASAQDAPKQGGEMIVTYKDDVTTLDPATGTLLKEGRASAPNDGLDSTDMDGRQL